MTCHDVCILGPLRVAAVLLTRMSSMLTAGPRTWREREPCRWRPVRGCSLSLVLLTDLWVSNPGLKGGTWEEGGSPQSEFALILPTYVFFWATRGANENGRHVFQPCESHGGSCVSPSLPVSSLPLGLTDRVMRCHLRDNITEDRNFCFAGRPLRTVPLVGSDGKPLT